MRDTQHMDASSVLWNAAGAAATEVRSLDLSGFHLDAAARLARVEGGSESDAVSRAVGSYLEAAEERPSGWRYPTFLGSSGGTEGGEVEVALAAAAWSRLEAEAERQGVSTMALAGHAVAFELARRDRRTLPLR